MRLMYLIALLSSFAFIASCVSKPLVTESMAKKEDIKDNLVIFPFVRSGAGKSLVRYDFRDQSIHSLVTLASDLSLEDVSADKDLFILKDQFESRLTVYSTAQQKTLFQKELAPHGKRIGIVRVSPDKKILALSWRPKGESISDDIVVIHLGDGSRRDTQATAQREISDLFWSSDGTSIFTATYDGKIKDTIWAQTDAKTLARNSNTQLPQLYFRPYYLREVNKCGFDLDVTLQGRGSTKNVKSIDKVTAAKRSPVIEFTSGLEAHPHGRNYSFWTTPSCKTALLRSEEVLYAIDIGNRKMAPIATEVLGTAEPIPAVLTK